MEKTADSAEAVNDNNVEHDNESEKRDKRSEKDGDSVIRIEERDVLEEDDRAKPVTPVSSTVASIEEPAEEVRSVSVKDVALKKKAHFRGNDANSLDTGRLLTQQNRILNVLLRVATCEDPDWYLRLLVPVGRCVRSNIFVLS